MVKTLRTWTPYRVQAYAEKRGEIFKNLRENPRSFASHFTDYPDVNKVLEKLLAGIHATLGDELVGLYLYGSLSSGDFDPRSSDIDFAAVTRAELTPEKIATLEQMHQTLWASGLKWAKKLEGAYPPSSLIRRHDPGGPACPAVNEGEFYVSGLGSDWIIQRHIIREYGLVLFGPDPKTLIDPVSPDEIRGAIRGILNEWWFPMLENPSWLVERGPEYHAYAVISMCRSLHGIKHGTIVSKPVAAHWAMEAYPQWCELIETGLASQDGTGPDFSQEALGFIRFVRET